MPVVGTVWLCVGLPTSKRRAATCWRACSGVPVGKRRDGEPGRERLCLRHQRHRCGQRHHRSDEHGNEHKRKEVQEETTAQPYKEKPLVTRTPLLCLVLHWRGGKRGRVVEIAWRRDGGGNHRVPALLSWRGFGGGAIGSFATSLLALLQGAARVLLFPLLSPRWSQE